MVSMITPFFFTSQFCCISSVWIFWASLRRNGFAVWHNRSGSWRRHQTHFMPEMVGLVGVVSTCKRSRTESFSWWGLLQPWLFGGLCAGMVWYSKYNYSNHFKQLGYSKAFYACNTWWKWCVNHMYKTSQVDPLVSQNFKVLYCSCGCCGGVIPTTISKIMLKGECACHPPCFHTPLVTNKRLRRTRAPHYTYLLRVIGIPAASAAGRTTSTCSNFYTG